MLTCITCSKQKAEDGGRATARGSGKDSVRTLTSQIKDMALKLSGAYKASKKGQPEFDAISEGIPYPYIGDSSSSTPTYRPMPMPMRSGYEGHDMTSGGFSTRGAAVLEDEDEDEDDEEAKEWMSQVEPGVHITFVSLPNGGNDLKRIRFNREMFDKWQAQRWWGENYDRIMELYNVQRFNRQALNTSTPSRSEDGRESSYSRMGESPSTNANWTPRDHYKPTKGHDNNGEASRTTTSSTASMSMSNASDMESEWVEQDGEGVYITIRQLADGTRELRRVRFSREKFGLMNAKQWWEENRERIQAQYL